MLALRLFCAGAGSLQNPVFLEAFGVFEDFPRQRKTPSLRVRTLVSLMLVLLENAPPFGASFAVTHNGVSPDHAGSPAVLRWRGKSSKPRVSGSVRSL